MTSDRHAAASDTYPSSLVAGHRLHVFKWDVNDWQVWLNTEEMDFDGICIGVGQTRGKAVAEAVIALEAVLEKLQEPTP
jgi:hypothetical protein